jgi:hypothetical protein
LRNDGVSDEELRRKGAAPSASPGSVPISRWADRIRFSIAITTTATVISKKIMAPLKASFQIISGFG